MRGRVLVADDEVLLLSAVRMVLEDEGYHVQCVATGEQCLDAIDHSMPDVLLLDVMMPGRNGLQVLTEIRREPRTQRLPVVLMSAVRPDALASLDAQAFLRKPFEIDQLLDAVSKVTPPRRQERGAHS